MRQNPTLTILVPVLDEEAAIRPFLERARPAVAEALATFGPDATAEWLFVNDGSSDATEVVLAGLAAQDPTICVLTLSRNFGKEAALAAGLDHARGQGVIPMDVDLQDPPEVIPRLVAEWRKGAMVVNARRDDRSSDSMAKRVSARWFYRVYNRLAEQPIPEDVGDFRLLDREVVRVIRTLSEHARFNKGLFSWVGFPSATVDYTRAARLTGQSKWPTARLWGLAIDGIVSSSTVPLRIWSWLGAVIALSAFGYALFLIVYTLFTGGDTPGFASIMVAVLMLGGLNMFSLGILGEYVGRIARDVRGRPLYVISGRVGFSDVERQRENS